MVTAPLKLIDAEALIVVAKFTATAAEKVAVEEGAKVVVPVEKVVAPAMVPRAPVNVPTPPKVTAPVEARLNVPELLIPPLNLNIELLTVDEKFEVLPMVLNR
jgi:hypothetical protein